MPAHDDPRPNKQDRSDASPFGDDRPRPKVRVTDKRRVRPEDQADQTAPANSGSGSARHSGDPTSKDGGVGVAGGSATEGRRSEAPPGDAGLAGHHAGQSGLDEAKAQAAEYRDHLQRLQAEFDNFRKRTMREQTSTMERASEPIMRRLLEVLDEFDLALMAAERTPDLEQFLRGVELVYAKLRDILESEGLQRIDAEGKPFDPELHEALMHAEGEADGELVVDDVFRQGYTLKGRVLRPAGVRVTRK
jgi:molecular chaperone GrpE